MSKTKTKIPARYADYFGRRANLINSDEHPVTVALSLVLLFGSAEGETDQETVEGLATVLTELKAELHGGGN